jgi:2-amino-4-hydroxy-6-hydroxymethyldihydropteridine diphosphokinase
MPSIYLSLGSNLGDRKKYINDAEILIENFFGTITSKSGLYETEPWRTIYPELFLNKVLSAESNWGPFQILEKIQSIEKSLGRIRSDENYAPRTIDIDILFIGNLILKDENLEIPHPHIQERRFVLEPMSEISANFIHPILNMTIQEMLSNCIDKHIVRKIS